MIDIKINNVLGLDVAIVSMRNPYNSWDKSDSYNDGEGFIVGEADYNLMMRLSKAGTDHSKFKRMIMVYVDILAPFYWWKEFDTYKIGTVTNSCSTMHTIDKRDLTIDDFSTDKLTQESIDILNTNIDVINYYRRLSEKEEAPDSKKIYWWQIIQLLPSSYNQKRTVMVNYEVLSNMYASRKNHKLDEWKIFCDWIRGLPIHELITGVE